jgi:hypothetical protein
MGEDDITLRLHHLVSLNKGYDDNYTEHQNGLSRIMCDRGRVHTDEAARRISEFYRNVAADPDREINTNNDIDDICRRCNNYDGKQCSLYREEDLLFEDERSLKHFPGVVVGEPVKVARILEAKIDSTQLIPLYLLKGQK